MYAWKARQADVDLLTRACEFLSSHDAPSPCDLIFVLAGRPERKPYGLELLRQKLSPRLILSVGRFEVRDTAALLELPGLLSLRDNLPPRQRHFWIDFHASDFRNNAPQITMAALQQANTFWELRGLASYLQSGRAVPHRICIISTSIHLRRVRYCCAKIPFFARRSLAYLAVPEEQSSFQKHGWWRRPAESTYLFREYLKLAGYRLLY